MLILIGVLFIAGMFLNLTPAMLIAAPLILSLVGILVFITAQISRTALAAIFSEVILFVVAVMAVLAIVVAVPATALALWRFIG
jgi:TRAP-type C4-dicarboxylate transport system permease large subunit